MRDTITAAKQITFDTALFKRIKLLESLASPGSAITISGLNDVLRVTFHGKEIEARGRYETACAAPFSFSMRGKDFMDIIKSFDDCVVTVREKSLTFKSGHTRMNRALPTDIPEPDFPGADSAELTALPQTAFRDAAYASYAAAQGGNNDAAERVSVLVGNGNVSIVATNGIMAVHVVTEAECTEMDIEFLLHRGLSTLWQT